MSRPEPSSIATSAVAPNPVLIAIALSLGAAIALGISRFCYGLLLPPMREDLNWSYLIAGMMNTGNALGYLIGALATPWLLNRIGAARLLVIGALVTGAFMLVSGLVTDTAVLLTQRLIAGIFSAFIFIAGGVLASSLGSLHPNRTGLLLGIYYGGTGVGIVLSALLTPLALHAAEARGFAHSWQWPWLVLGIICFIATALMSLSLRHIPAVNCRADGDGSNVFRVRDFSYGLLGYFMFGVGYIGYMTFVVALLKQQGMTPPTITAFYALLGLAVIASSRIWAGLLDRYKGGQSLAILNGLVGIATLAPALTAYAPIVFLSGLLFGGVFLSVVASTTALVRHNLPPQAWSSGISAFTTVFAFGQIVGPTVVGWIADGTGGLERGLIFSALALLLGSVIAARQPALTR